MKRFNNWLRQCIDLWNVFWDYPMSRACCCFYLFWFLLFPILCGILVSISHYLRR